jgi:sialate O-acetylesterase
MLNPVIGYTIKGALWYQGESNVSAPIQYETLFPDMVKLWRAKWGQGVFPFYYTQIAPFNYNSFYKEPFWYANSAYLRDAQRKAQYTIPASGMTCLLDVGEMNNIHPIDKKTPGERLALIALNQTYGVEGIGYATPDYDELNIVDTLVTVTFKNLPNGITSYSKKVTAFEIAGDDKVFYPATCKVRNKTVQVFSPKVKKPVAVRYAFTNEGSAQLFSTDGIPLTSFRTDDWDPETVVSKKGDE